MTNAQKTRAMRVLDGAYRHLSYTREPGTAERALTIIAEATRILRNGHKVNHAITYDWFNFDVPAWDGGQLYTTDTIEVR